jgi:hypothetical protein
MSIIPSGIFQDFYDMADLLITEVNASDLELFYRLNPSNSSNSWGQQTLEPFGFDRMGGRVASTHLDQNQDSVPESIQENLISEKIKCRVYWEGKDIDKVMRELGVDKPNNVCKIICFASDYDKLKRADYAIVNGLEKVKIVKSPFVRGLGPEKRYCNSFWQVIS